MPKVKELIRDNPYSKNYDVVLEDGTIAKDVEVYHSYKTLATAVATVAVPEENPALSTRQMDGVAKRLDPRFRLRSQARRENLDGTHSNVRNYYIPSEEQVVEEFLKSEA